MSYTTCTHCKKRFIPCYSETGEEVLPTHFRQVITKLPDGSEKKDNRICPGSHPGLYTKAKRNYKGE